jgi:hypothetical protein
VSQSEKILMLHEAFCNLSALQRLKLRQKLRSIVSIALSKLNSVSLEHIFPDHKRLLLHV